MKRAVAIVVAALALILVPATAASAAFKVTAWATTTVSTGTVAPPTAVAKAPGGCSILLPSFTVTWTAPASTRVADYSVAVSVNGGAATTSTTTATSYRQTDVLSLGRTITVSVRTHLADTSWTSLPASVTFTC